MYHDVQLVGATAVAVGAAALLMYRRRHAEVIDPPPTSVLTGEVVAKILPESADEHRRDFDRFHRSHAIFLKQKKNRIVQFNQGGLVELASLVETKCNLHRLMYSLSTSIGIDVLTKLKIVPLLSQPIFLVDTQTGRVELFAFIGSPKGSRPEAKFTDWVIRISLRTSQDIIDYDIEPAQGRRSMIQFVNHHTLGGRN